MNPLAKLVCAVPFLAACSGAALTDGGTTADGGRCPVEVFSHPSATRCTLGDTCSIALGDDPCHQACSCAGDTWSCERVCPSIEPCRHGGYCGWTPGTVECEATDAGCVRVCECEVTYGGGYSWCKERCESDGG